MEEYCPEDEDTNLETLGVGVSSWYGTAEPLCTTDNDVAFWLLYGNAPSTGELYGNSKPTRKGSRGYLRNVSSLVLVVRYGATYECDFVACGDATGLTLAGCNEVFDDQTPGYRPRPRPRCPITAARSPPTTCSASAPTCSTRRISPT